MNEATNVNRTFGVIIEEFAHETGLGLEIDDKGSCSVITGETIVTIQYREDMDDVALFSVVTPPEDAMSPAVMHKALDADKSYYLANSTGDIKEAGAWQKFKCWLGVGDGIRGEHLQQTRKAKVRHAQHDDRKRKELSQR